MDARKERKKALLDLLQQPGQRDVYIEKTLEPWRARRAGDADAVLATPNRAINGRAQGGWKAERVGPVFWPLEVYKAHHEGELHPDQLVKDFQFKDETLTRAIGGRGPSARTGWVVGRCTQRRSAVRGALIDV